MVPWQCRVSDDSWLTRLSGEGAMENRVCPRLNEEGTLYVGFFSYSRSRLSLQFMLALNWTLFEYFGQYIPLINFGQLVTWICVVNCGKRVLVKVLFDCIRIFLSCMKRDTRFTFSKNFGPFNCERHSDLVGD